MNWKALTGIAVIIVSLAAIAACNGFTMSDHIDVKVPPQVRDSTQTPTPTVPLSQAPFVRERYLNEVKVNLAQFDQSIADARVFADFVGSLLNTGLTLAEGPLQGVPLGGAIFAGLGGLVGLFVRKPGTQKEIDKAWDEASEKARQAMLEALKANT